MIFTSSSSLTDQTCCENFRVDISAGPLLQLVQRQHVRRRRVLQIFSRQSVCGPSSLIFNLIVWCESNLISQRQAGRPSAAS